MLRVLRAGLCGTDLHLQEWDDWAASTVVPPLVIGHEFYGEVVELGADVTGIEIGDRASGEGHIVCGRCRNCRAGRRHLCIRTRGIGVNRDGAFADYVALPASNVWVQPRDLDPDLGAVFDPLGNATHTALQWPMVGEDVVITGAGPIGVMAAAIARHAGARYVVEMSGAAPAVSDLIDNMNHGGRIALLGLPHQGYQLDWGKVITHMLTLKGIYGREMYDTWYAMSQMIATSAPLRDAVTQVITHRFPAEQWEQAFATARSGQCGKVILDWS